jgi:hypothetical protein
MDCYGNRSNFYMWTMFVPHREHTYGTPRPLTGTALLLSMQMMFVPHRKHGPPRYVTEIALRCYMWMIFVPHRKHLWASTVCYKESFTIYSFLFYSTDENNRCTESGMDKSHRRHLASFPCSLQGIQHQAKSSTVAKHCLQQLARKTLLFNVAFTQACLNIPANI